jgi:hypothetical protein
MGADTHLKGEAAPGRRITLAALYGIIMTGALELGEIARMEAELQKRGPVPPAPYPHCPCWHAHSTTPPPSAQPPHLGLH